MTAVPRRSVVVRAPSQVSRLSVRHLAVAGEMMLDDKGAVKAEPLGLDIVFDEIAEAFAAVELGRLRWTGAPRRRAAEQTEPHRAMLLGRKTVGLKSRRGRAMFKMPVFYRRHSKSA